MVVEVESKIQELLDKLATGDLTEREVQKIERKLALLRSSAAGQ